MTYTNALKYLKTSPLFNLSLSSKELFHSNFLYWIWKISPSAFLSVMQGLGINTSKWPQKYEVRREYEKFDLCVLDGQGNIIMLLENKVKSIPYKKQLDEYDTKVQKLYGIDGYIHNLVKGELVYRGKCYNNGASSNPPRVKVKFDNYNSYLAVDFILLTLPKHFPNEAAINAGKWKIVDYKTYLNCISNIKNNIQGLSSYDTCLLCDYYNFLDALVSLYDEWHTRCYAQLFVNNTVPDYVKDAEQLRIHDLYHKSKYARICTDLQSAINTSGCLIPKNYIEVENNDSVILSQTGNCISYGFGFTNGEPFVEVKIKPAGLKQIFVIQVQGKQYRHAVAMNHGGKGASGIWNQIASLAYIYIGSKPYPWMRANKQQFINPPTVINPGLISKKVFATNAPLCPVKQEYLKFAGNNSSIGMIYQYRVLDGNVTTQDLINYIVEEVKNMLK